MIKRVVALLRDYFGMSHKEARGFSMLLLVIALLLLSPWFYRLLSPNPSVETSPSQQRKLDSLLAIMQDVPEQSKSDKFKREPDIQDDSFGSPVQVEHFAFNPNTVSIADLKRMGVPHWLAERIGRYRSKGGLFRKKEDLLRIYDFPQDLYNDLEPYIQLEPNSRPEAGFFTQKAHEERPTGNVSVREERPAKPLLQPFDINAADTTQLIQLKGIGSKLAARIIKFRDALGGFVSASQYDEIFGLDSLARQELHRYTRIQTSARKIPINSVSAEELDRHPFISRRQAEIIIRYREQHGAFQSVEDLKGIRILDDKTREKMAPYLRFD